MHHDPDSYNVGLKLFITAGEDVLLLYDPDKGQWDLPGGRINVGEEETPIARILAREAEEELGPGFRYELEGLRPVSVFRAFPASRGEGKPARVKILLLGFPARYVSGEPVLSDEHSAFKWVNVSQARADELFSGGFADGFRQFQAYFLTRR